jgi:hypothetical protein
VEAEFIDDIAAESRMRASEKSAALRTLEELNLWAAVANGWVIHDYLDHNPSRARVEAEREKTRADKSNAGKKGASARWGNGRPVAAAIDVPLAAASALSDPGYGPDPTRPIPTTPLDPPKGGNNSRRKRDREKATDERAEWVRATAELLYPASAEAARFAIGTALLHSNIRTVGDLDAFIADRYPEIAEGLAA